MERTLIIYHDKETKTVTMTEKRGEIYRGENKIEYVENRLMDFKMDIEKFTSQLVLQKLIPNFDYFEFIKIDGKNTEITEENKYTDIQKLYTNFLKK